MEALAVVGIISLVGFVALGVWGFFRGLKQMAWVRHDPYIPPPAQPVVLFDSAQIAKRMRDSVRQ